jgi:hypothetical protein
VEPVPPARKSGNILKDNRTSTKVSSGEKQASPFSASKKFVGSKPGFVFKTGSLGLGYYADSNTVSQTTSLIDDVPPPSLSAPPTDVKMSLLHQAGSLEPHLVEIQVGIGAGLVASDIKVDLRETTCILSSSKWTSSLKVPLKYSVTPAKSQGWIHQGTLTVRFPIAPERAN